MANGLLSTPTFTDSPNLHTFTNIKSRGFAPTRTYPEAHLHMGYINTDTNVRTYIWNGTTSDISITNITSTGTIEGISPSLIIFPQTVSANSSVEITFLVEALVGPLEYDATFTIHTSAGTEDVRLSGLRAAYVAGDGYTGLLKHNWATGLTETYEWFTEVLTSYDRTEQRMQRRQIPRRTVSWELLETGTARRKLESALYARTIQWLFLPLWYDVIPVAASVNIGETSISAAPDGYSFYIEGSLFITDGTTYESCIITGIASDSITVASAIQNSYQSSKTYIVPAYYFELKDGANMTHHTDNTSTSNMDLRVKVPVLPTLNEVWDTYKTHLIFPFEPDFMAINSGLSYWWDRLSNGKTDKVFIKSAEPIHKRSITVACTGREDIVKYKDLLHTLKGKVTPFWLPTHTSDVELAVDITSGDTSIYINDILYTAYWEDSFMRSVIAITTRDQNVTYFEITATIINPLNATQEILTLQDAATASIAIEDIVDIRFMELVRLDTDVISITWDTNTHITSTLPVISLHDDQARIL